MLQIIVLAHRSATTVFAHHSHFCHLLPLSFCRSLFRHVILPKEMAKTLPKSRLLTEAEWRGIGVQQSRGWQHYAIHRYVCLFACFVRGEKSVWSFFLS